MKSFGTIQAQRAWSQMNPKEDTLSPWLEERERPLTEGAHNFDLLPMEFDGDNEEAIGGNDSDLSQTPSDGGGDGGLSPPNNNNNSCSGDGGDNISQS
ncbi:hypothetical protein JHK82_050402 [Glycine max]|nr:hypothetical protein JHK87_050089 [Glycine soja]KAG5091624.1 hypothetical protein JHK82_050402 [Glycine max]